MKLTSLMEQIKHSEHKKIVAVAQAADTEVLKAVKLAIDYQLASFLLIGDELEIVNQLERLNIDQQSTDIRILHASSDKQSAKLTVQMVHDQMAHVVMKGNIPTSLLLKEVLNKDYGLRTGRTLSHVAVFEIPNQDRLIMLTDAAMNISPNLSDKVQIVQNAVDIARKIGISEPKVAALAAVEVVNENMQATIDAALLTQMQKRGQIKNCIIDGPLAFDNAVSVKAAKEKNIESEVAGCADILLVPSIETGNALYKSFIYFANAKVAAVISGAQAPIVLTSRADSHESKVHSLALSLLSANNNY